MSKTDLLFQMMEQPQRYTANEWQEILTDDECRELYTLMSMTQSAMDAVRADEEVTDEMIEEEWVKFEAEHFKNEKTEKNFNFLIFQFFNSSKKIAAIFVGILMLSAITYAAIHLVRHTTNMGDSQTPIKETRVSHSQQSVLPADTAMTDTIPMESKLYDNVPLEQMLKELSTYYHIKVEYRTEAARTIRLFYQWKPDYSIEKVVEMLNNFEWLNLDLERDTLYVSSNTEPQP